MLPYKDTMIFMAHGINSDRYTWYKSDSLGRPAISDGTTNLWLHYLNKELGIDEQFLHAYSFSAKSGYHEVNMLELGARGYKSEASDPSAENNKIKVKTVDGTTIIGKTGIAKPWSWIEQAESEYRNQLFLNINTNSNDPLFQVWKNAEDIPNALLPSKLVMLAHSQGNFAVRGYIHSGSLLRKAHSFYPTAERSPDRLPQTLLDKYRENPLGFYEYPVEKVIFINPALNGGEIETFLLLRAVKIIKQISEAKALSFIKFDKADAGKAIGALADSAIAFSAGSEDYLTAWGTNPLIRYLMEPISVVAAGDIKITKTRAEWIVFVSDRGVDSISFVNDFVTGKIKFSGVQDNLWDLILQGITDGFRNGANALFSPLNVWNRVSGLAKITEEDNLYPGQSYYKGFGYVAEQISPFVNPKALGPIIDSGFVNAFSPSVGDERHVGPGGTEKILRELVLADDLRQVGGSDIFRKWQPKYRMVNSVGSIAPNGDMTRIAAAMEALGNIHNLRGNSLGHIALPGGFKPFADPYMTMTLASPGFWGFNWNQKFYALMLSKAGGVFTNPGDIVVTNESLQGKGIRELEQAGAIVHERSNQMHFADPLADCLIAVSALDTVFLTALGFGVKIPDDAKGLLRALVYEFYFQTLYKKLVQTGIGSNDKFSNPYLELVKHLSVMDHAVDEGHGPDMDKSLYEPPKVIIDGLYQKLDPDQLAKCRMTPQTPTVNFVAVIAEPGKPVTRFSARPESNWAGVKFTWPSFEIATGSVTPNEVIVLTDDALTPSGHAVVRRDYYQRTATF
ncbi:hypothetical protein EBR96_04605, partial [bacterium]|nr:hypothetical protein [bacterium]